VIPAGILTMKILIAVSLYLLLIIVAFVIDAFFVVHAQCSCRRSKVHIFLMDFDPLHPRARWIFIQGVVYLGTALVIGHYFPGRLWYFWAPFGAWNYIGFSMLVNFVWHEKGKWKRGLRAAKRAVKQMFTSPVGVRV
jgi:hypothetical protein